jgi:hypothetical protein
MRTNVALLVLLVITVLYPERVSGDGGHVGGCYVPESLSVPPPLQQSRSPSACTAMRDDSLFANCVDDVASFRCRHSSSFEALNDCFVRTAIDIIGKRTLKSGEPFCLGCDPWGLPGLFACSVHGLSGAPPEWCFRNDAKTVSWCEGDPPNHKCKNISCPLSSCTGVFARCGMVYNPNLK